MSFDIKVRVDTAGVAHSVAAVGQALGNLETRADRADGALERWSQGAREGSLAAEKAKRSVDGLAVAFEGIGKGLGGLGVSAVLGSTAGIFAELSSQAIGLTQAILRMSDAYTSLGNRLRQVAESGEQHAALMQRTLEIANRTRTEWTATGEMFTRLSQATREMGISQERVLRLTETISKAFQMSGASATEASAGMLQLSQAFAAGRLQGDEFRSLAESVPSVLTMIAQEMGVSRDALKQLGSDGKITADVLLRAFEGAQSSIDAGFAQTAPTLSQQWTVFGNKMTDVVGKLVQDLGLLDKAAAGLDKIATALDKVASATGALDTISDSLDFFPSVSNPFGFWERAAGDDPTGTKARWDQMMGQDAASIALVNEQMKSLFEQIMEFDAAMKKLDERFGTPGTDPWQQLASGVDTATESIDFFSRSVERSGIQLETDRLKLFEFRLGVEQIGHQIFALGETALSTFEQDIPSAIDVAMASLGSWSSQLGTQIAGVVRQGLGGGIWGMTDEDIRKRILGTKSRGTGRRTPQENPWANGPDWIATGIDMAIQRARELSAEYAVWGTIEEPPFLQQMIDRFTEIRDQQAEVQRQLTEGWNRRLEMVRKDPFYQMLKNLEAQATDVAGAMEATFSHAFRGIENSLISLATTGKASWRDMVDAMIADVTRLIIRLLIAAAVRALADRGAPGGFASALGTGATQSFPGMFGSSRGFASGGSFMVGGNGGRDTTLVSFLATRGEDVTVRTREQREADQRATAGRRKQPVTIVIEEGRDEAEAEDFVLKVIRRRRAEIRGVVTGR